MFNNHLSKQTKSPDWQHLLSPEVELFPPWLIAGYQHQVIKYKVEMRYKPVGAGMSTH